LFHEFFELKRSTSLNFMNFIIFRVLIWERKREEKGGIEGERRERRERRERKGGLRPIKSWLSL
jgi:hypothetical protein